MIQLKKKADESLVTLWKKRIILEKDFPEPTAEWMAKRMESMIDYMQYGHVLIAFSKQNGDFCLIKATLIWYESDFHKKFDVRSIQNTIVYWDVEHQGWRTFRMENFLEWRPLV